MKNPAEHRTRLVLLKVEANNTTLSRFGFIVSKNVDKNAVIRNRVKRLFQECANDIMGKIQPGYDMLFIVHRPALKASKEEMCVVIQSLLKREKLL